LFDDTLNRHTIPNAAKGHAARAFGGEMLTQCCHRSAPSLLTHAALRLQFVLPFLFGKINALSQESFYISPLQSIAYSSPVTGCCYQAVLTWFITSILPAPTIHLILFWLFFCFDLRMLCFKTTL